MAYKKTVWVIDIFDYLTFINECLDQLSFKYPWLRLCSTGGWFDREVNTEQREDLIDWIIRQQIHEMFYLWPTNHYRSFDCEHVHAELVAHFPLHTRTRHDIFIPNMYCYGDIHPGRVIRRECWLYIECEVTTSTLEQYALSPNATARNTPKRTY